MVEPFGACDLDDDGWTSALESPCCLVWELVDGLGVFPLRCSGPFRAVLVVVDPDDARLRDDTPACGEVWADDAVVRPRPLEVEDDDPRRDPGPPVE